MSVLPNRSRLSGLSFIDPQDDPSWTSVRVPASSPVPLESSAPTSVDSERALAALQVLGAGASWSLAGWLAQTHATSLLVVADGQIVHEWYAEGVDASTRFLGASMSKSALAHLVGRAVRAGSLRLDDRVVEHVPELAGSGYEGSRVLDVLTMTTGVQWVEDHRDPQSLASRLLSCFALGGDSRELLTSIRPAVAPGARFVYNTADSQVLDWVRERVTGRSFTDDLELLWRDLGCTDDAVVGVDGRGVALGGGAIAATARDWAKVALLAVDGTTAGVRILDRSWIDAAGRPAYPFCAPGRLPSSITTHAGFGYHWWPLDDRGVRLTADGSRGQFACADRDSGAVIVKTSLWPYEDPLVDRQCRDLSYLGLHALLDCMDSITTEKKN